MSNNLQDSDILVVNVRTKRTKEVVMVLRLGGRDILEKIIGWAKPTISLILPYMSKLLGGPTL